MQSRTSISPKKKSIESNTTSTERRDSDISNKFVYSRNSSKMSLIPKIITTIDFTSFETTINNKLFEKDFFGIVWPKDDIIVEKIKRENDLKPIVSGLNLDTQSYINELALLFFKDWRVVKHKYVNLEKRIKKISLPQIQYEIDMNEVEPINYKSSKLLDFEYYLDERYKTEDIINYIKPKQIGDRSLLFFSYPMEDLHNVIDMRPLSKPPTEVTSDFKFKITPVHLSFDWGLHEPIFGVMTLYDVEKCHSISESFYFDLNNTMLLNLLSPHISIRDLPEKPKSCIFSTSYKNPNIYLTIIFTKCLRGNENSFLGPYITTNMKDKEREKYISEIESNILLFGEYRQVFGFVALQVFNKDKSFKLGNEINLIHLMRWKQEKDMCWLIERYKEFEKNPKSKSIIPISFTMKSEVFNNESCEDQGQSVRDQNHSVRDQGHSVKKQSLKSVVQEQQTMINFISKNIYLTLFYQNYLFLYPETVYFGRYSYGTARNILLEVKVMESDSNLSGEGLPIIYGTSITPQFVPFARTSVSYHSKKPVYFEEIKVKLPIYLNEKHNIVVSFYHVSCSARRSKTNSSLVTLLGRSVILLYPKRRIIRDGRYSLPIALNLSNENYIKGFSTDSENDSIKWVDNGKSLFSFSIRTLSTIYPQDNYLDELFKQYEGFRFKSGNDKELLDAISNLFNADFQQSMDHFPATANMLFYFMLSTNSNIQTQAFSALIKLVSMVYDNSYDDDYLTSYVDYVFENFPSKVPLNQILIELWCFQLLQNNLQVDILKCSDFLFEVLFKSMVLYLYDNKKIGDGVRTERFSLEFKVMIRRLINQLGEKVYSLCHQFKDLNTVKGEIYHHKSQKSSSIYVDSQDMDTQKMKYYSPSIAKRLVENIAKFIRNLFSIFDRGMLLQIIQQFLAKLTPSEDIVPSLVQLKFNFLKIIADYEYYILVNLPVQINLNKVNSTAEISKEIYKTHFLAGLVVQEVMNYVHCGHEIRFTAINTLRDILWNHEHDERFKDPNIYEYIAQMYFPFVFVMVDNWVEMRSRSDMENEERRSWLICFVWFVKNSWISLFQKWWKNESRTKLGRFLMILVECLEVFEYLGSASAENITTDSIGGTSSVNMSSVSSIKQRLEKRRRVEMKRFYELRDEPSDIKNAIENFYTKSLDRFSVLVGPELIKKMMVLSREVSVSVLNVVLKFIYDYRQFFINRSIVEGEEEADRDGLFSRSFGIYIKILAMNQSQDVCIFALLNLKWIVTFFQSSLFEYRSTVCGELTSKVIQLMNSRWGDTRVCASNALLLMIRYNHICMGNFLRLKLLSTVAASELFASPLLYGIDPLCEALKILDVQAHKKYSKEKSKNNYLSSEIKDLTNRMGQIIRDNIKVNESSYDPESQADYYHSISKSYFDSPDLRIPELEKLAQLHFRLNDFEECAMVRVTQAILISEYLRLLNRQSEALPVSPLSIFPSLESEVLLPKKTDLVELSQEICQTKVFSEDGFVHLLQRSIKSLKCKSLYEACIEVYRLLLPVYQYHFNYSKQSECYADLNQLCKLSMEQITLNNRLFPQYYRVGFYYNGTELKDLNEMQFVYKESGETRLSGIQERLKSQYGVKISPDCVHFVSNLKKFERQGMAEGHLYIQLMSLEPYFMEEELEKRKTPFKLNWNINRFIYETPIVNGESLKQQWKRKTIITVDGAFPCLKKRLKVKNIEEVDLSPIETATETIIKKVQSLYNVINTFPRNTKIIQRELQGSLMLQVNVGPSAIAEQFLKEEPGTNPKMQQKLSKAFLNFLTLLAEGLQINSQMISVDQLELQNELKNGYYKLKGIFCKFSNTPEDTIIESFASEPRTLTKLHPESYAELASPDKESKTQHHS